MYVWLWSTHGVSVLLASWIVVGGAEDPVGTGLVLRAGQHHEPWLRRHLVAGAGLAVRAEGDQRVVGLSGTKTVPPLLTVWSTPWSKNWPKNVNSELYGGERPTSVVTFGMNRVWCDGTQPAGTRHGGRPRVRIGGAREQPGFPWRPDRNPAAATAAGFVDVWSTIRLLMMRGCESKTRSLLLLIAGRVAGAPGIRWEPGQRP